LPRRMVPVITVHRGLSPPECISLLGTQGDGLSHMPRHVNELLTQDTS
jgi:hypothetical protein